MKPNSTVFTTSLLAWNALPGILKLNCCAAVTFLARFSDATGVFLPRTDFTLPFAGLNSATSLLALKRLFGRDTLKPFLGGGGTTFFVARAIVIVELREVPAAAAGERATTRLPRSVVDMVETVGERKAAMLREWVSGEEGTVEETS